MKKRPVDLASVRTARTNLKKLAKEHPDLLGPSSEANRAGWESALEAMMQDEANDQQIVVRLPGSLLERIDTFAASHQQATGLRVSRSDAVRLLVARALAKPERRTKAKKRR